MKLPEREILEILSDLKDNHRALSLKAELEDEGSTFEEIFLLRRFALQAGLDMTVKVGGCGALNDMREVKKSGAERVVAPMIESAYAFEKFVHSIKSIYSDINQFPELWINIESVTGYQSLRNILSSKESVYLTGINVGKCDMSKSMGLGCEGANGSNVFKIVQDILNISNDFNKKISIGGGISPDALNFIQNLGVEKFHQFETRKIAFDSSAAIDKAAEKGILKAIDFEILWLKCKQQMYGMHYTEYAQRIEVLEQRCKRLAVSTK